MQASLKTVAAATLLMVGCASTQQPAMVTDNAVLVYAAGSLREALTAIAADYEARTGQAIALTFGASGLLRERIERGEAAQVFASADTEHPQRLHRQAGWQAPAVFARNTLCALTSGAFAATPATILDTLLRPDLRLGTSTPKADPSGDYAWSLFEKAEAVRPGAYVLLSAKARKLAGGADSPKPPGSRGTYGWIMDTDQADVFLTYCTNAVAAQREVPRLQVVQMPPDLQVGAAYGLTVRREAGPAAVAFAAALLAPDARATFRRFGFGAP